MGRVLGVKAAGEDKVNITLEVTQKEALWLKGNMEKVHLFSENNLDFETRLIQRGKKDSTKYFLLPKELRDGVLPSEKVECNRIDTKTKYIFVMSVPKF